MPLDVEIVEERRLTFGRLESAAELEQLGKSLVDAGQNGYALSRIVPEERHDQREGKYPTGRVTLILKRTP